LETLISSAENECLHFYVVTKHSQKLLMMVDGSSLIFSLTS